MPIIWKDKDGKEWVTHRGLTMERKVRVERVMSDIYSDEYYAVVWNPETEKAEEIHTGSAFELFQGPWGRVVPDADEILAAHRRKCEESNRNALARIAEERKAAEAARPDKGKMLRVVRGRKLPKGLTGLCIWYGSDKYKRDEYRVGIKDEAGNVHWTSARNVEVAA